MSSRPDFAIASPGAYQAMLGLGTYLHESGSVESKLLRLVKLRVSQINGCAYCLDMHSKELRAAGETEQRLYLLDAWRETTLYSERERAALAWAEAVTQITDGHVPDEVYAVACAQFDEHELADLTLAVTAINAWNRLLIAFRERVRCFQPKALRARQSAEATR